MRPVAATHVALSDLSSRVSDHRSHAGCHLSHPRGPFRTPGRNRSFRRDGGTPFRRATGGGCLGATRFRLPARTHLPAYHGDPGRLALSRLPGGPLDERGGRPNPGLTSQGLAAGGRTGRPGRALREGGNGVEPGRAGRRRRGARRGRTGFDRALGGIDGRRDNGQHNNAGGQNAASRRTGQDNLSIRPGALSRIPLLLLPPAKDGNGNPDDIGNSVDHAST